MTFFPLAGANMFILAILAASGAGMVLFAFLADAVMAWGHRVAFNRTFGFPGAYRVTNDHAARDRSRAWVNLRVNTLGHTSGIRVQALMTDEGLAIDARTLFGFRLMRTPLVPWRALRLEVGPPPRGERTLVILAPEGSVAVSFPIAPFDLRWRDALAARIDDARDLGQYTRLSG